MLAVSVIPSAARGARALSEFIPILAVTKANVYDYSDKINRLKSGNQTRRSANAMRDEEE